MTILESIQTVSAYPVPAKVVREFAEKQGLNVDTAITNAIRESGAFKAALAEAYEWLADAPNVSQGGVSYNLNDIQRRYYRAKAESLRLELGMSKRRYGLKGRLL